MYMPKDVNQPPDKTNKMDVCMDLLQNSEWQQSVSVLFVVRQMAIELWKQPLNFEQLACKRILAHIADADGDTLVRCKKTSNHPGFLSIT